MLSQLMTLFRFSRLTKKLYLPLHKLEWMELYMVLLSKSYGQKLMDLMKKLLLDGNMKHLECYLEHQHMTTFVLVTLVKKSGN